MSEILIKNLSFTYDNCNSPAISDINLEILSGELVLLMGASGSGKTTLIRCLKNESRPLGVLQGSVICGKETLIGFLDQNVDAGLVTDTVWHELAFGLENMGCPQSEIRIRTAELASYFGLTSIYHKKISELSGGMKQLVALASVMVMNPGILLLDEPTSQLDPIAAEEFLRMIKKIHDEIGTTIIISEHRVGDILPIASRVIALEHGSLLLDDTPVNVAGRLFEKQHTLYKNLPACTRIYLEATSEPNTSIDVPLDINSCRKWIRTLTGISRDIIKTEPSASETATKYASNNTEKTDNNTDKSKNNTEKPKKNIEKPKKSTDKPKNNTTAVETRNITFSYEKNNYILHHLDLKVKAGSIHAIVGANGSGKSTLLSVLAGITNDYSGRIFIGGRIAMMNQNPELMFTKDRIRDELKAADNDKEGKTAPDIEKITALCGIEELLDKHPLDVSGGELQKAALARVLITNADILLLDEPTKGMDGVGRESFVQILRQLREEGKTVIIVSHDLEFVARAADTCSLLFDGSISVSLPVRDFFVGNSFYTTDTLRISKGLVSGVVYEEELIKALAYHKKVESGKQAEGPRMRFDDHEDGDGTICESPLDSDLPLRGTDIDGNSDQTPRASDTDVNAKLLLTLLAVFVLIPVTIIFGVTRLNNRKYYFISLLIILEMLLPVFMTYERKAPKLMEIVITACMCALTVIGRLAFYMTPNFKPTIAMVIISGIAMGPLDGFIIGAISMLVSNMLFMQGPWTPWQMFAMGLVGFAAGVAGRNTKLRESRIAMCLLGAFSCFFIYGLIMNPASILMYQDSVNRKMIIASYVTGFPMDAVQALATVICLFIGGRPVLNKMKRTMKYMEAEY